LTNVIGFIWNQILIAPATNFIVMLDRILFGNFGLAIIVFTLVLRAATYPLTRRQIESSKKMQQLQPKIQEIQKKYSDPKRRSEEQMKLYKEEGVNPAGCLVPMLIQFPIWIALYQVIRLTLAATPESLIDLSHRLYPWSFVQEAVPLTSHFLWLNLGKPDTTLLLPLLVFLTMWLQQKLTMTERTMAAGGQSAQTNQMMLWFMPILFAWFSLSLPSGLGLYWVVTNIAGIVQNFYVFEWNTKPLAAVFRGVSFNPLKVLAPQPRPAPQRGRRPEPAAPQRARNGRRDDDVISEGAGPADMPLNGQRNGTANRRRRPPQPSARRNQPKAPPAVRRAPPATGRLQDDPASGNGGPETRSGDGRGA
jgi:YidC/Oxa1 family membrane protein insertase